MFHPWSRPLVSRNWLLPCFQDKTFEPGEVVQEQYEILWADSALAQAQLLERQGKGLDRGVNRFSIVRVPRFGPGPVQRDEAAVGMEELELVVQRLRRQDKGSEGCALLEE
jgi:hypothetical protein